MRIIENNQVTHYRAKFALLGKFMYLFQMIFTRNEYKRQIAKYNFMSCVKTIVISIVVIFILCLLFN